MRWCFVVAFGCWSNRPQVASHEPAPSCAPELLARLDTTEREWFEVMDLEEKYAAYPRSRASELRARPYLDEVFGTNTGGAAPYTVECHANACRISVNTEVAADDWMLTLQTHPAQVGLVNAFSFGRTTHAGLVPTDDDLRAAKPSVDGVACLALEARLADVETRVEVALPAPARFVRSERTVQLEDKLRPALDEFFARHPGPNKLECRGDVCRIDHARGSREDFQRSIGCAGVMFGAADASTTVAYCTRDNTALRFGVTFKEGVFAAVRQRAAAAVDCQRRHPSPVGEIQFDVTIGNPRSIVVTPTGSLAGTPAAACFREIVDAAISEVSFPVYESIELPKRPIRFWVHAARVAPRR